MKKVTALFLAMILSVGCTACSGSSVPAKTTAPGKTEEEKTTSSEEALTEEETKETEKEKETETEEEKSSERVSDESIEETVLLDESGVVITAKRLEKNSLFGPELKLLIENNSGKSLTVQCKDVCINGYMVDNMMSETVADGKKGNADLNFLSSDLERCGIEAVAQIEIVFHIFDSESWDEYLDTELISLKTAAFGAYEQKRDDSGEMIYEGNDVRIICKGLTEDSIFGKEVLMYIENNSSVPLTFAARDVSVNGFMTDAVLSSTVLPGKCAVDDMTFMDSSLEENEIEDIETVEMSFHIYNSENWDTLVNTDPVTVEFK